MYTVKDISMKNLTLSFCLFSVVLVQAQSQYNMQPVPSSSNFTADDFDTHADAVLEYSGNSPVVLRWNITNVNMPKSGYLIPASVQTATYRVK